MEDHWLYAVSYVEVGFDGERVDKKQYISQWETTIRNAMIDDPVVVKIKQQANGEPDEENPLSLSKEEEDALAEKLNRPEMYFNEENLRHAYRQPNGTLIDFIKHALGLIKTKTREEEILENFHAWLVSKSLTPKQAQYLSLLKNRGIVNGKLDMEDLFSPPLSILNAAGIGIELFGETGLQEILKDLNEAVFIKRVA